jgi:hypothetical protein
MYSTPTLTLTLNVQTHIAPNTDKADMSHSSTRIRNKDFTTIKDGSRIVHKGMLLRSSKDEIKCPAAKTEEQLDDIASYVSAAVRFRICEALTLGY